MFCVYEWSPVISQCSSHLKHLWSKNDVQSEDFLRRSEEFDSDRLYNLSWFHSNTLLLCFIRPSLTWKCVTATLVHRAKCSFTITSLQWIVRRHNFLASLFLFPASTSPDRQLSGCENKEHGCHSFYYQWIIQYFKIDITLKCVLKTFSSRNTHFIFIILAQWMYVAFSLLVFMKIIAGFTRKLWSCHVWYRCYGGCMATMTLDIGNDNNGLDSNAR